MKLNATIANLRLFNSGVYKDVTLSFPSTTEKIHSALRKIAIDGRENKEILITQYETDIKGLAAHLGEYENIDELNYLASRLAGFSPYEMAVFSAAVQHGEYSNSMQDLINLSYNLDCFTLYPDIMDAETYGRTLLEDIEELETNRISTMRHTVRTGGSTREVTLPRSAMSSTIGRLSKMFMMASPSPKSTRCSVTLSGRSLPDSRRPAHECPGRGAGVSSV